MSSSGMNVRPTIRLSGIVSRTATTDDADDRARVRQRPGQRRGVPAVDGRKNRLSLVLLSLTASAAFRKRELSIGVSVKLTTIDTMIANAIVQPNG